MRLMVQMEWLLFARLTWLGRHILSIPSCLPIITRSLCVRIVIHALDINTMHEMETIISRHMKKCNSPCSFQARSAIG